MRSIALLTLASAAVSLASGHAAAQVPQTLRYLYSPPLLNGDKYACTLTNASTSAVTISQWRFDTANGVVSAEYVCSGFSNTVQPGQHCFAYLHQSDIPFSANTTVACRVRHNGGATALLGSLQGFWVGRATGIAALQSVGTSAAP